MTELIPSGFVFHQSNLQAFMTCRYRFLLRYIQKMPWPAPLSLKTSQYELDQAAGSSLHALIHQFFLGIKPSDLLTLASHFPDPRVRIWFDNFLASPFARIDPCNQPETSLQISLDGNILLAKFDLIAFEGDAIRICDWKSSRKLPKREFLQNRIQTLVYPLIAAHSRSKPLASISMCYWEANFPDQPIFFNIANVDLQKARAVISNLIATIRSLDPSQFEQTLDLKKCTLCEYQSYCSRGSGEVDENDLNVISQSGLSERELLDGSDL